MITLLNIVTFLLFSRPYSLWSPEEQRDPLTWAGAFGVFFVTVVLPALIVLAYGR